MRERGAALRTTGGAALRTTAVPILQCSVAPRSRGWPRRSSSARPFFAPISAIIVLGVGVGVGVGASGRSRSPSASPWDPRRRRAHRLIGTGTVQLGLIVALAMAAAVHRALAPLASEVAGGLDRPGSG